MSPLRIGIVAGEASGDRLGAALIGALRDQVPHATFKGMAGPRMIEAGCDPIAHIDELSVMGLAEVVRSYPRLRRLRNSLADRFMRERPDVVIGIDVPDFNLGLEARLKRAGIRTVHFVCPQAWAWRAGRAKRLAQACDKVLALLPFEPAFFSRYGADIEFVGHPLADSLPLTPVRQSARESLGVPVEGELLALMPGSRRQEIERLAPDFITAARQLVAARPGLRVALCVARPRDRALLETMLGDMAWPIFVGRSTDLLTAADVAVVASGTVTLEAFLCATPIVVGYRLAPLSYHIIRRMVTIPHIALPNILTDSALVPEFIQDEVSGAALKTAVLAWLEDPVRRAAYVAQSRDWHARMQLDAARRAATAILTCINSNDGR